jgi:uncharacterized repeat protein (TIGR01451 family)
MLRTLSLRLAAVATIVAAVMAPSALNAQKALVYCPVGIDAGGCTTIVAALNADAARFPDGADAGYDGTQGTLDLATADFSSYAVFVVPSLADGPDAQPYALLRNGTIAARLQATFVGRVAVWSGTPDVGTTNRSSKDALIRNLAAWARGDAAGTHGPGVMALQDNSDDPSARYGWLGSISVLTVSADTTFDVYANVQVLTSTGQTIVTSGGLQLGYTNMASFGLIAGANGRNDATGDRSSRVVLVTAAGEAADPSIATVSTDKDDYAPGDTVTVTGTGWEPGETVSLLFHEDANPPIHPDKTLTALADELGHIVNHQYDIDSTDIGVRFTLTATGQTSGRTAQTTFTDNKVLTVALTGAGLGTVTGGEGAPPAGINCPTDCSETVDNNADIKLTATAGANSTIGTWSVLGGASSISCPTGSATCTFNMNNKAIDVTVTFNSPDLTITKTHTGTITVGTPFNYVITVKNSGTPSTSGTVTVNDALPVGLTWNSTTATGWSCSGTSTIQCTRSDALAPNGTYPTITLNVTPTAAGTVTNTATVTGGGESNTGNNSASDPTTVVNGVDLTIDKSHSGDFTLGANGAYTLAVANGGGTPTTGTVTVTDVLPGGLALVSAAGTGWTCNTPPATTVTCTRTTAIAAGVTAPSITLTVSVAEAAFPSVTNTASVSGGGEPAANNGNNTDTDPTTVVAPDLTVDKSHTGNFTQGVNGTYSFTVSNTGGAATSGTVTVADALPTGLGFVSGGGGGWSCAFATGTVTCTRGNAIGAGNSAPSFTITVSVGAAAVPSVTNTASVSGGGEPAASNGNNSDSDPTTVGTGVDLTIDKSHTGSFTQGVNGTYTLTVSNPGTAPTSADVTVTDNLPAGLTFVSGAGTGWTACTAAAQVVTCVRPAASVIAAGGAAPAITLTVSVSAAAIPSVTNSASVAGGGEPAANNGNNSDSDPTTVTTGVDLTIDKSHTGNFTEGVNGSYSLTVSNAGGAVTSTNVTVTDVLPAGLGFVSGTGTGWNACTVATQTVTCVRPAANTIAAGGSAPAITLTVTVAATAVPSVTNTANVAGGGEPAANNGNNSDRDPTTVIAANGPPVVEAGGPYTGDEGSAIALNGASVNDPDAGDTPTLKWTYVANGAVDAGTTCSFSNEAIAQPTFTCNDDGAFTVTLTADDGHGHVVHDDAGVTVNNVKPTANAGGPYTGNEGSGITLSGSGDDPGDNDDDPKLTYQWSVTATGIDASGSCSLDDATKKSPTVTCDDDSNGGHFTVGLIVTDNDGASSTESTANLTVNNLPPVADVGGPYTGAEGSDIELHGSANDPGDNDDSHLTYHWSVDATGIDNNGTCTIEDANAKDTKVTCTDDSDQAAGHHFTVSLVASDDDGGTSVASTTNLTVTNVDPVADAGGGPTGYSGNEGADIPLHGSATDAGSNDTFTWGWQYTAGADVDPAASCEFSDEHAQEPTVKCTDNGTVTLTLTVKDDDGGEDSDNATLTVNNVAPTATGLSTNSPVNEGSDITLSLAGVTDPSSVDAASLHYAFDCGSGYSAMTYAAAGATNSASCSTNDNGTRGVKGKVFDKDGGSNEYTASVTINNVPPTATFTAPTEVDEGTAIGLSLTSPVDPSSVDVAAGFHYAFDCGDGNGYGTALSYATSGATSTKSCPTNDNGSRSVKAKIFDKDNGATEYTGSVTIKNVPPTATFTAPTSVDEGTAIGLSLTNPSDPSSADVAAGLTYAFDCGDGAGYSVFAAAASRSCPTTDNGTRSVGGNIQDKDGGVTEYTGSVTVNNVPPSNIVITKADGSPLPASIIVGGTLAMKVTFFDPGTGDTHTATIDCGSGPTSLGTVLKTGFPASCTYSSIGTKTITVKVTDDDGGVGDKTVYLTVKYTFVGFSAPVDRPTTMNVSKAGQAIPLKWQLLDANGQPVTNLTAVDIKINSLSCGGNVPTDLIEEYASGASGLRNLGGGNYQFNWKTPNNYAGTCKNIGLDFGSGYVEMALANFNFKS